MRTESIDDLALLRFEAGSANAMSRAMLEWTLGALDGARDARAVIVTGYPGYFSAGLDLPSLVDLDRAGMRDFIELFGDVMVKVHEWPGPVVAAMSGHAVAGGCILALQCDHRVMADGPFRVGLTAAQLGFGLPSVAIEAVRQRVPASAWAAVVLEGRTFLPDEAQRLGLVDELCPPGSLEARAIERARELARTPPAAYRQLKLALRSPAIELVARSRAAETEAWLDTWFSDEAQRRIQKVAEGFRKAR